MMMSKYTLCTRVCKEKKEKYILKNLHTMYKGVQEKKRKIYSKKFAHYVQGCARKKSNYE